MTIISKKSSRKKVIRAALRATLAAKENRRESLRYRQISASSGAFFLSALSFQHFSFTQIPLFPRSPGQPIGSFSDLTQEANALQLVKKSAACGGKRQLRFLRTAKGKSEDPPLRF